MKQDLSTRSQTCRDTDDHELSSKTCIKKKFRLFGIEIEPYENVHSNGEMGRNESVNSSTPTVSSEREKLCMDEGAARAPESTIFECQYCRKEFTKPQALGGHQNAHKKERLKKKRLEIQAREASISCYLQHFQYNPSFIYHDPTPFFYQKPQFGFSPFNQNLGSRWYSTPSHLPYQKKSHTFALASADQSAETRSEVVQPSLFSSSQQNNHSLDLYLGLR